MLVVSWFIGGILCFFLYCYLFNKFLHNQKFVINLKMILLALLIGLGYYIISEFNLFYLRFCFVQLSIFIGLLIMYKQKKIKTLIGSLCIFLLLSIAELVFGFLLIFLFSINVQDYVSIWYYYILSNVLIYLLTIVLSNLPFMRKIVTSLIEWFDKNEYKTFFICIAFCVIVLTFFLYNNFIEILPSSILLITNLFCVGVVFFVISYFKEKSNNNRIVFEYDQLLDYVKKYERVVEDKSKRQHEYKNQLVMIKSMMGRNNKKVLNYIDELYNDEKDDNDVELLKKLQYLPSGGLKGLIYYKIEEMIDKKINVFVDISPRVKNIKINKKIDNNLKDISKIIGVYLDNATEACSDSKEKYIVLEIYLNNNEWVFSLSNTYEGTIDTGKMDNEGYTTKGESKGYGLSLAKDLINKNKDLRQEREIKGIYFVQRLYMKK